MKVQLNGELKRRSEIVEQNLLLKTVTKVDSPKGTYDEALRSGPDSQGSSNAFKPDDKSNELRPSQNSQEVDAFRASAKSN